MSWVALVEDERDFRESARDFLVLQGLQVFEASHAAQLAHRLTQSPPIQVVVLDINLGEEIGFDIATTLHHDHPDVGIIMLTGRDTTEDYLMGLSAGADIYLAKPVDLRILEAKIQALLRRLHTPSTPHASWTLNRNTWNLTTPDGDNIPLTATELAFLTMLAESPGVPVAYANIVTIFQDPSDNDIHRASVLLNRLRQKVMNICGARLPVKSARSVGYSFTGSLHLA
ncbi:two component transcriptional regulator, winged helix family [Magnetococcus marinus MC-1]|uniref:Two component transcriptional regulator, winged helix family n=1 Tax=Magnetococcus marinus (strain ATCC BAA-1437 / JCM 17883 / MC-1) TaxID=156889 RepID=A0LD31_MAGMM|nr:response regulator transcription factor [Magnetococcus marinus]ABK45874.1 two component transcriptional regulator, winged helix family [Magnetococcus marinus MC-1]